MKNNNKLYALSLAAAIFLSPVFSSADPVEIKTNQKIEISDQKLEDISTIMQDIVLAGRGIKVLDIEFLESKPIPGEKDWKYEYYYLSLDIGGKELVIPKVFFSNGKMIAETLYNTETLEPYLKTLKPDFKKEWYKDLKPLYGNANAKHRVVLFSDPMCPFCKETLPPLVAAAKKYPDEIALYYFANPLKHLHPQSSELSKIIYLAEEKGKNDVILDVYAMGLAPSGVTSKKDIISYVKTHTGFTDFTEKELSSPKLETKLKAEGEIAKRVYATATPVVFIDEVYFNLAHPLKKLLSKDKQKIIKDQLDKEKIEKLEKKKEVKK